MYNKLPSIPVLICEMLERVPFHYMQRMAINLVMFHFPSYSVSCKEDLSHLISAMGETQAVPNAKNKVCHSLQKLGGEICQNLMLTLHQSRSGHTGATVSPEPDRLTTQSHLTLPLHCPMQICQYSCILGQWWSYNEEGGQMPWVPHLWSGRRWQ